MSSLLLKNRTLRTLPLLAAISVESAFCAVSYDFSGVSGSVVSHAPALEGKYFGNPSICKLSDSTIIVSHDFFGPSSNCESSAVTRIFASKDGGKTWTLRSSTNAYGAEISSFGDLLLLTGNRNRGADFIVKKSVSRGFSWTNPVDESSGLVATGTFSCASTLNLYIDKKIHRALIDADGACVFSVSILDNPLEASKWARTSSVSFSVPAMSPATGWCAPNAIADTDGGIKILLSVESAIGDIAALVIPSESGSDLADTFYRIPGGSKKFTVRHDSVSGKYYALTNWIPNGEESNSAPSDGVPPRMESFNSLTLVSSANLVNWKVEFVALKCANPDKQGFAAPNWIFDGDDILCVAATAWNDGVADAASPSRPNMLTFHRIRDFRNPVRTDAYGEWTQKNSLLGNSAEMSADLKSDGATNLERFAFGMSPNESLKDSPYASLKISEEANSFTLSYRQRDCISEDGIRIVPFYSCDMLTWTPMQPVDAGNSAAPDCRIKSASAKTNGAAKIFVKFEVIKNK